MPAHPIESWAAAGCSSSLEHQLPDSSSVDEQCPQAEEDIITVIEQAHSEPLPSKQAHAEQTYAEEDEELQSSSSRPCTVIAAVAPSPSIRSHSCPADALLPSHTTTTTTPPPTHNNDVSGSQSTLAHRSPPASCEPPRGASSEDKRSTVVQSWRRKLRHTWLMSKGMVMVMLAQFFGSSMNVMTRTLQLDGSHGKGMHPFQILFARMGMTVLLSFLYMLYARVPHPFGIRSIRPLLLLRGVSGFIGVFGLYYSLLYLALSEATVLTFLAPIGSCYACSLTMPNETFTRRQQLAALSSLVGVVLIARPASLFRGFAEQHHHQQQHQQQQWEEQVSATGAAQDPYQRTLGTLAALLGVTGATVAYTSIRIIGKRTHPLVSVTYFSGITTIISLLGVALIPAISFRLPGNMAELLLLLGLGTCGFLLQFLLTAGLSYVPPPSVMEEREKEVGGVLGGENAGVGVGVGVGGGGGRDVDVEQDGVVGEVGEGAREGGEEAAQRGSSEVMKKEENAKPSSSTHGSKATSMVYTQMLFALLYDKLVFNATPSPVSWAGSAIILASAIYVALVKERGKEKDGSGGGAIEAQGEGEGSKHTRSWNAEDVRLAEAEAEAEVEEGRGLLADYDDDDDHDDYDFDVDNVGGGNGNGNGNGR
ncbi:DUF6 domain-containing protein, variant [Blastomyces dermatitidis ATCC 18188]|uniref:DUF6 domain-containing protein n=1 Tax=Ajellomyces dermatitidis (strain ATCC 18188 / CBS 674.68) TaxID=653446 RepID=F2T8W6_AJEDA|nr:DUF6 domain-containing protein [Blastomyces dermatitidis ATCC 18188]KMW67087.1 DUF6 domain-containing protein, variant [Blastomyces dermatitidis ATCC 18188]